MRIYIVCSLVIPKENSWQILEVAIPQKNFYRHQKVYDLDASKLQISVNMRKNCTFCYYAMCIDFVSAHNWRALSSRPIGNIQYHSCHSRILNHTIPLCDIIARISWSSFAPLAIRSKVPSVVFPSIHIAPVFGTEESTATIYNSEKYNQFVERDGALFSPIPFEKRLSAARITVWMRHPSNKIWT